MGITARGAWESVKRHFRELGVDTQSQDFTCAGVGDMSGDVFGNGMLHTPNIRLLGAFDGRYIFIDPNPDPLISFAERRRLFQLPQSTWRDHNPALLSQGGGVYRRDAKDIPLSPEVRAWLGVRHSAIDGEALVRWLLIAPVDLLWMGGVGTYVKASSETNESVGDRVNDGARVDALQLRAKVVGEGANLAFTQRGRIEYALRGGRINTDAVDNSAGVDLSDHEVNLKTLLHTRPDQNAPDVGDPIACSNPSPRRFARPYCTTTTDRVFACHWIARGAASISIHSWTSRSNLKTPAISILRPRPSRLERMSRRARRRS
jgi:glutamate dehydrogenase